MVEKSSGVVPRYDEWVLGLLLDRYERSSLSRGENQVRVSIALEVNKSRFPFPEYFDLSSGVWMVVHEQLQELERQGLVTLQWKKGNSEILRKVLLCTDEEALSRSYALLGRTPRREQEQKLLQICEAFALRVQEEQARDGKERGALSRFLSALISQLSQGKKVAKAYADPEDPGELRRLLVLMDGILAHAGRPECFVREFSIETFHDSKVAERELSRAARVIRDFARPEEGLSDLDTWELLSEYGICKNPSLLMMKGHGAFTLQGQRIELDAIPGGMALTNEAVPGLVWEREKDPCTVLTIENLTSFHRFPCEKVCGRPVLVLYLGGYANRIRRSLLMKIHEACPQALYLHFGDLDAGGFRIWRHLCRTTGISFLPYLMDARTLETYADQGRALSENDKKALAQMLKDPDYALSSVQAAIRRILELDTKVEQECIEVRDCFWAQEVAGVRLAGKKRTDPNVE